ncbi:hypothetical protein SCUCBS95973_006732 [Sporothrix curviconia]|uniref:Uncharacterized protein n=1 Tax=Sporothrix curviconia TaxID=1260050 RepID=A0ABP0C7V8_9PEZI
MSDTSDFTMVGDADQAALQPDSATGLTAKPLKSPTTGPVIDEALEIMDTIREGIPAAYNFSPPPATESTESEVAGPQNGRKALAYAAAKSVVEVLRHFQKAMLLMTDPEADLLFKVAVCDCQAQAVQRTRELLLPDQAEAVADYDTWKPLDEVIFTIWSAHVTSCKAVADMYISLLPKYVHACAGFHDNAEYLSDQYIAYAEHVLSNLEAGSSTTLVHTQKEEERAVVGGQGEVGVLEPDNGQAVEGPALDVAKKSPGWGLYATLGLCAARK